MSNNDLKEKFLAAVDLMEFGISLMKQNISRRNLGASQEEIDLKLQEWLFESPESPFDWKISGNSKTTR